MTINHLSGPLGKQKFTPTGSKGHGLWFVIGVFWSVLCVSDSVFQGSLLLNFGVCVFSCFRSFSSQFLYLLTKIRQVASLDSKGEYSASKSRRNTDMGGWKQINTFPTTFNFAASAHYCHFYLTGRIWCYRNGLIKVKEKPKILKRVRQHRLWVIQNSCKMMNK